MNEQHEERRRITDEVLPILKEMREDQIKIKEMLFGNGKIGLCEKVRMQEEKVGELIEAKKWITKSFFGIGFTVLTTIAVLIVTHFFKK